MNIIFKPIYLKENKGHGNARRTSFINCDNNIIAIMDSDDISLPTRCEKQIAEFEKNVDLDIVGCSVIEFIGVPSNKVGKRDVPLDNLSIYKYCRKRDPFNHPTVMYRKSRVEAVGGYSDLRKNQDTDLWIRMLEMGVVCANLSEHLLYFRFDENTYKKRKNWINTKLLISIRWKAVCSGFCSLVDFLEVAGMQMMIYIMPLKFQEFIYQKFLRG